MVKLFVGNLAEGVSSDQLRKIFSQFAKVTECDVLKNYAFVHVDTDDEANEVVKRLDGYIVEGRPIHIEKSTSKLRKQPGMGDKCFRCGAADHKTTSCPHDPTKSQSVTRFDLTQKRPMVSIVEEEPAAKRSAVAGAWGTATQPATIVQTVADTELARPQDPELFPLYEQYLESRQRYFYYRDSLLKEIGARTAALQQPVVQTAPLLQSTVTGHDFFYFFLPLAANSQSTRDIQRGSIGVFRDMRVKISAFWF